MTGDRSGLQSGSSTGREDLVPCRTELPVLGVGVVRERADAARNRERVLAAAERLFAERGVAQVTMDDVAAAAGVGKGTLYRRFTDRGGLAVALLDQRERQLQQAILTGPPPLGPGASAADRLAAFVTSYLFLVDRHLDLVLLSQTATPGARLRTGAHAFWRQHCTYLLREVSAPHPDVRADLLLAGLSAEQVRHWLHDQHHDPEQLAAQLATAARTLTHPGTAPEQPLTMG